MMFILQLQEHYCSNTQPFKHSLNTRSSQICHFSVYSCDKAKSFISNNSLSCSLSTGLLNRALKVYREKK